MISYLRVLFIVILLSADPAAHQVIPDRVREREVVVAWSGHIAVFNQSEVKMPVKALFDFGNISQPRYTADTDLLALLLVGERFGHVANAVKTQRMKVWTLDLFCTAWWCVRETRPYVNGAESRRDFWSARLLASVPP